MLAAERGVTIPTAQSRGALKGASADCLGWLATEVVVGHEDADVNGAALDAAE